LLFGWDPIGVFAIDDADFMPPEDEYDCLIPKLYERLRAGDGESELLEVLTSELIEHFGLSPRPQIDRAFAAELVRWWNAWQRESARRPHDHSPGFDG
jgi:hypothetical protein